MFTIETIAKFLNTDKTTAYGLVRFLEEKGVITHQREKNGKRGKPRNLYTLATQVPQAEIVLTMLPLFEAVQQYAEDRKAEADAKLAQLTVSESKVEPKVQDAQVVEQMMPVPQQMPLTEAPFLPV